MKHPSPLPESHFEKYSNAPVKIKPYSPKYKKIASEYLSKINKILEPAKVKAIHKGATALGISGKGDVEFIVYPKRDQFDKTIVALVNHFKSIKTLNYGFARFLGKYAGYEVEVVAIQEGDYATMDKKLNQYLKKHPKIVKEYEKVKNKFSFSAKEYAKAKDRFLRKVIEMIPTGEK